MPRLKKEYMNVSLKIDKNIGNQLNEFTEETGLPKTVVIEKAVTDYIQKYHDEQNLLKSIRDGGKQNG